jgi:hypothetical protein
MTPSKLQDTPMFHVYLLEVSRLVEETRMRIAHLETYWRNRKPSEAGIRPVLVIDPEIQRSLHTLISDVARLSNLIRQEAQQSAYSRFSKLRTTFFGQLFPFGIKEIHSRAARNSLEHFEERIDKENRDQTRSEHEGFIYACMFSDADALKVVSAGRDTLIRVFVFDEMRYINFGSTMSLRTVGAELEQMRSTLLNSLGADDHAKTTMGAGILQPPAPPGGLTSAP